MKHRAFCGWLPLSIRSDEPKGGEIEAWQGWERRRALSSGKCPGPSTTPRRDAVKNKHHTHNKHRPFGGPQVAEKLTEGLADWLCEWLKLGRAPWRLRQSRPQKFLGHPISSDFSIEDWLAWVSAEERTAAACLVEEILAGGVGSGEFSVQDDRGILHRVRVVGRSERGPGTQRLWFGAVDRGEIAEPWLVRMTDRLRESWDKPDALDRLCQEVATALEAAWVQLWEERENAEAVLVGQWGLSVEEEAAFRWAGLPPSLFEVTTGSRVAGWPTAQGDSLRSEGLYRLPLYGREGRGAVLLLRAGQYETESKPSWTFLDMVQRVAAIWFAHARVMQELEEAARLKSDFVSTMSHELRTPLNTLMGYTDLLAMGEFGPVTAEQHEVLERMSHSARELLGLINATLDLRRFERRTEPLLMEEVSVPELLRELEGEISYYRRRTGVELSVEIDPRVSTVRTDRAKLRIVLKSLLSNAFKFTERGWVRVSAQCQGDEVELSVVDTGIGIASEVLPIIFEPFRQGEPASTRRFGGVGLGLYVARRVVEMLGGRLTVESEPGKGSTFRVRLPSGSGEKTGEEPPDPVPGQA